MDNTEAQPTKQKKTFESPFFFVFVAVVIFLFLKIFFIDVLLVNGHSMEPILSPGKIVFVNRLAYGLAIPFTDIYAITWGKPRRNDIIVLKSPIDGTKLIKRCVAEEGDTIIIKDGILYTGGSASGDRKSVV
jgi:signal peptidase I